ncbi:MAG: hypothetical protein ACLGPL_12540, partial [Acidobacteriota bacterium]
MDLGTLKASITLLTSGFSSGVRTVLSGLSSMEQGASGLDTSMESVGKSASATAGRLGAMGKSFSDASGGLDRFRLGLDAAAGSETLFDRWNDWAFKMPSDAKTAAVSFQQLTALGLEPATDRAASLADAISAIGGASSDTLKDLSGAFATESEAVALPVSAQGDSKALFPRHDAESGGGYQLEALRGKLQEVETSLSTLGLDDYHRALAEINDDYDAMLSRYDRSFSKQPQMLSLIEEMKEKQEALALSKRMNQAREDLGDTLGDSLSEAGLALMDDYSKEL